MITSCTKFRIFPGLYYRAMPSRRSTADLTYYRTFVSIDGRTVTLCNARSTLCFNNIRWKKDSRALTCIQRKKLFPPQRRVNPFSAQLPRRLNFGRAQLHMRTSFQRPFVPWPFSLFLANESLLGIFNEGWDRGCRAGATFNTSTYYSTTIL